ncbi:MAG: diacylglycerol kinase family protein, partial [Oscillospiraceae bacterium]
MRNLLKSFKYAFRGIFFGLKYERNMRIHFVAMIYMYSFLLFFDFFKVSAVEFAIIFLANALVIAAELINTSIERTVDLASEGFSQKGMIAKDTAAGAV